MDYGSALVYIYSDCSDEEYVSDTELQEGMWLSDSDDEDKKIAIPTPLLSHTSPATESTLEEQFAHVCSQTKYLMPEKSSEEEEENGDDDKVVTITPTENLPGNDGGDAVASGGVEITSVVESKKMKRSKHAVKYAELTPQLCPMPNPHHQQLLSRMKPEKKMDQPPSPPSALPPIRGIIKNRLNSKRVKKVKQGRVNWFKQEESHHGSSKGWGTHGRRVRRSDTNILAVKFNTLAEPSDVYTGDAVMCSNENCSAIMSHMSSLVDQEEKEDKVWWMAHKRSRTTNSNSVTLVSKLWVWVCEFCGEKNEVDIVSEEIPTQKDTTYMITPALPTEDGPGVEGPNMAGSLVVFCIDVSGSMCVTAEVPGKFDLKGHERVKELASLNTDSQDQYLPRQSRNVTYVTRLQSVQAAVDYHLTQLVRSLPTQRVALVTFSDEVNVIGDGSGEVMTLAGDKLWSVDSIMKAGGDSSLPASVASTSKALSKKLFELEEEGQTALGPALLVSISLASCIPGSKVIICTDGLANKGIGNLDGLSTAEERAAAQTFYEDMGTLAQEKNVLVSLVRIKGTDCKALELGQVADKSGGQVTTVDPVNITKEFSSILANPVIATCVNTKLVLHGQLYFRSEDSKESVRVIPVGNVTAETELTYEYGVRRQSRKKTDASGEMKGATPGVVTSDTPVVSGDLKVPPLMIGGKPHLPFQVQIEYTGRDGSRCMRVISDAKPITRDRGVAENGISMGVVGTHVAHETAKLAIKGEYTNARLVALSSQRLLQRSSYASNESRMQYNMVMEDIIPLENELRTKQQTEKSTMGRQYSDEEYEEEFYDKESALNGIVTAMPNQACAKSSSESRTKSETYSIPKTKKAISRRKEISDDLATYCYNMRSQSYTTQGK